MDDQPRCDNNSPVVPPEVLEEAPDQGGSFHWTVDVEDPYGRDREWEIGARDGKVVVRTPPGEGFIVKNWRYLAASVTQAGRLAESQQ